MNKNNNIEYNNSKPWKSNLIIFKRIKPNIMLIEQPNKYFFRTKLNMSSIE